jgi:hypothetical protein
MVELLMSLFIVSVAVVFATFLTGTIKTTRDSTYENIAFRVADAKLSVLRAGGYAALPASGPFTDPNLSVLPEGAASTTVADWNAKTKQITVGVSWLGSASTTKYVLLTTLVTQSGGL